MTWTDLIPWNWGKKSKVPVQKRDEDPLVRKVPADPFESFHQEFNKALDDFWHTFGWPGTKSLLPGTPGDGLLPRTEVVEGEKELIVTAELPGVDEKDVELTLEGNELVVRGERRSERHEEKDGRSWIELRHGSFQRVLTLPEDVDEDHVEATFKNGILRVTLPRRLQTAAPLRQITVRKS